MEHSSRDSPAAWNSDPNPNHNPILKHHAKSTTISHSENEPSSPKPFYQDKSSLSRYEPCRVRLCRGQTLKVSETASSPQALLEGLTGRVRSKEW